MFSILSHKGNANQNYIEIPSRPLSCGSILGEVWVEIGQTEKNRRPAW
jgi:hypothetical protein